MDTPAHQVAFQALTSRLVMEAIPEEDSWDAYALIAHIATDEETITLVNFLYFENSIKILGPLSVEAAALLSVWRLELPEDIRWQACVVQLNWGADGDLISNALLLADDDNAQHLLATEENVTSLAVFAQPDRDDEAHA